MTVRAKFECISSEPHETSLWNDDHSQHLGPGIAHKYVFQAVTGNSPENNRFFASTPGGRLEMYAVRDDLFAAGKSYYLDFSEAE